MGAHGDNSFLHCERHKSTIERETLFATITEQITRHRNLKVWMDFQESVKLLSFVLKPRISEALKAAK